MAADSDLQHRTLERIRELDHAHQSRVRTFGATGLGLALRLRLLRTMAARLTTPSLVRDAHPIEKPQGEDVVITFVGHGTVLLSTSRTRVLVDPMFGTFLHGMRRFEAACLHATDANAVNLILLTSARPGHLHRSSLRRLPRSATVVVPVRCADLVAKLGFAHIVELGPGDEHVHDDLTVTAVAARHESGGILGRHPGGCGYVMTASRVCAYASGDTGYFSGFAQIGRRLRPDVAILPIAGYEPLDLRASHLSPLDALAAFEDLGAKLLIPVGHGSFPVGYESVTAPAAWLRELATERGFLDQIRILTHGESCRVRPAAFAL